MAALFDNPVQMEPLLVGESGPSHSRLLELAHSMSEASARLDAALPTATARSLSDLVTGMNCYYSNLIEGHHTLPLDIEKALQTSTKAKDHSRLRSLAYAHIEAERWAKEQQFSEHSLVPFLLDVHRVFCEHLPNELLTLEDGARMEPGRLREREVHVGLHLAPKASTLPQFLSRFADVYGSRLDRFRQTGKGKLDTIVAAFAAHHRLAWIHPFPDGNGRVARIVLDAMLRECDVNRSSLWSMSRGFAKTNEQYKQRLAGADERRMGDLDGRGNLSELRLAEFCEYAMQTAIDQAAFMTRLFGLDGLRERAEGYFQRVRFDLKPESAFIFLQAFKMGEIDRGEAIRVTGLHERTARNVLSTLLEEGFLRSDSPKGRVRAGFPVHGLGSLFPNLYPAGDVDVKPRVARQRLTGRTSTVRTKR